MNRHDCQRFKVNDRVEILEHCKAGHVRIPFYVRGKIGLILQYCGRYLNPEDLAIGKTSGPAIDLYRVQFDHVELWGESENLDQDRLVIEIYDHWLKPIKQLV
jgi:hypothetical protein